MYLSCRLSEKVRIHAGITMLSEEPWLTPKSEVRTWPT
jgi:hypothetical protein